MSSFLNNCKSKVENVLNLLKDKFKIVGEWFYQWLSPQFKIPTLRIAYFIESFFGAILKSDQISKTVKRTWLAYHIFSSSTVLASTISYILLEAKMTPFRMIHAYTPIVSQLTIICVFYIFYRFHQTTEIGKKLEKMHLEITHGEGNERDWSVELKLVLKFLVLPILFLIAKPILLLILSDEDDFDWNDVEIYVYPSPIINFISSPQVFLLMQLFQIFTYVPIATSTKFFGEIAENLQNEYFFHFRQLKKDFESHAEKLANATQPIHEPGPSTSQLEPHLALELHDLALQMNSEINFEMAKYEKGLISSMERYQTLVSSFVSFKYQLEYGFAVLLVFVYPWLIFSMKQVFLHTQENIFDGLVIGVLCMIHFHVLIRCCELGEKFQEMIEMIYDETCGIPWYQLNVKMKKTVYIFLHRTQQSVKFRSLKIFSVNRSTLVRLFAILYGVVLFHVILNRI